MALNPGKSLLKHGVCIRSQDKAPAFPLLTQTTSKSAHKLPGKCQIQPTVGSRGEHSSDLLDSNASKRNAVTSTRCLHWSLIAYSDENQQVDESLCVKTQQAEVQGRILLSSLGRKRNEFNLFAQQHKGLSQVFLPFIFFLGNVFIYLLSFLLNVLIMLIFSKDLPV